MSNFGSASRRRRICERVRQVRIKRFGTGHGAQKLMAKELGIPYTTYRGYEKNRISEEFLILLSKRYGASLHWLLAAEEGLTELNEPGHIIISNEGKVLRGGRYETIEMLDSTMSPTLPKGAVVGYEPFGGKLQPGRLYVILLSGRHTIRFLKKESDKLIAYCEAKDQLPVTIPFNSIIGIVVWYFCNFQNSVI